ncbi:MAG: gltT [Chlamydiales bacterium]|jgi:Na+/H+-dicarboxylate symporter|nr:gltT [Chlamydiales bacterium]
MKLWLKTLIGLVLGILIGLSLRGPLSFLGWGPSIFPILKLTGELFLKLIKMTLPLLLLSSMAVGVTSIRDFKKLGRIGLKTFILFIGTTVIAITLGYGMAQIIKPGFGIDLKNKVVVPTEAYTPVSPELFNFIPENPIAALASNEALQILFFALLMGIAINLAGDKGDPLLKVLSSLSDVMCKLISLVMSFAPYGVCAIMAWVAGTFGWQVLTSLFQFLFTVYSTCFVHMGTVYVGILLLVGLNPWYFFKGMKDAIIFAYTSSSSSATLPTSLACAQDNLGVPAHIANFVLPLGATVNMNGTATFQAIAAVFIAQAYGIELTTSDFTTIVVIATLSSIGTAGAPGASIIFLGSLLHALGLPTEGIGLIWGVDRLRDMMSTVVNVLGDGITAVFIAKRENELNEKIYYTNN